MTINFWLWPCQLLRTAPETFAYCRYYEGWNNPTSDKTHNILIKNVKKYKKWVRIDCFDVKLMICFAVKKVPPMPSCYPYLKFKKCSKFCYDKYFSDAYTWRVWKVLPLRFKFCYGECASCAILAPILEKLESAPTEIYVCSYGTFCQLLTETVLLSKLFLNTSSCS